MVSGHGARTCNSPTFLASLLVWAVDDDGQQHSPLFFLTNDIDLENRHFL